MKIVVAILFFTIIIAVHAIDSATSLIESKILGGQYVSDSMQETYSYVVFVTVKYEEGGQMYAHPCTGSLISTLHILGTARCTHSGIEKKYINVDGISINVGSNYRKKGLKYYLTALYLHKYYKYSGKFDPNDIAVMELRRPVSFTNKVSKIDILETEPVFDAEADALGWGGESIVIYEDLVESEKPLKIVKLKTITVTECKRVLRRFKNEISTKHICVKEIKKGENIYQGDIGGPLIQGGKLIGVAASGFFLNSLNTSVFVGVFHHLQFINDAMNYETTDESSSSSSYKERKPVGLTKLKNLMCGNSHKENEVVQYIAKGVKSKNA